MAGLPTGVAQRAAAIEQALRQQRLEDAGKDIVAALALAPQHPEILRLFGVIQFRRGHFDAAIATLLQAREQRPDDPMIHNALGGAYEKMGDPINAREALRRACELAPEVGGFWFNYARCLFADGATTQTLAALERAVVLQPQHLNARAMLANILRDEGRLAEAAMQFRSVVAANPAAGQAWWSLAMLRPMPLDAADIATLRQILRRSDVPDSDRIAITFALAMALEHAGDFGAAFAAMNAGHALAARHEPYDAPQFSKQVGDILEAFPPSVRPANAGQGEEVIFIASLPRSGSTLTEQILGTHSQVEGTNELHDLGAVLMGECDRLRRPFTDWARSHTPEQWQALGQAYLARTQRWRQRRPRFTDKMPANWMYVGAILAMLPNARVVICRRDPLETCLGCYRYVFARHPYTHDFADLASHWRDFDRAVGHWKALYPQRVREQVYEELLADPEGQIRALLDFCGLPFETACLNFHENRRAVSTLSAAQVREPLRRDTARANNYGALLDPLRQQLGLPPFRP
jgi:tetratricopeptide (TPR) repeat protein